MSTPAERVEEILGLKSTRRGVAGLAAAVEKGLPRSALMRVIARSGATAGHDGPQRGRDGSVIGGRPAMNQS